MAVLFNKWPLKLPLNLSVRRIEIYTDLDQILEIEKICFPKLMRENKRSIIKYFKDKDARGYILYRGAVAIGTMYGTLLSEQNSPDIMQDHAFLKAQQSQTFYLSSTSILPQHRGQEILDFFFHELFINLKQAGFLYLTGHARINTGYSLLIRRRYGVKRIEYYDNWSGFDEPFDYIYLELNKFPLIPNNIYIINRFFSTIRYRLSLLKSKII